MLQSYSVATCLLIHPAIPQLVIQRKEGKGRERKGKEGKGRERSTKYFHFKTKYLTKI